MWVATKVFIGLFSINVFSVIIPSIIIWIILLKRNKFKLGVENKALVYLVVWGTCVFLYSAIGSYVILTSMSSEEVKDLYLLFWGSVLIIAYGIGDIFLGWIKNKENPISSTYHAIIGIVRRY